MAADPGLHVVPRPTGTAPPDLEALVHELQAVLDAIRAGHRDLADHPDPHGPREAEFDRLRHVRAGLEQQIGVAVSRLLASGGSVVARGRTEAVAAPDGVIPGHAEPSAPEVAPGQGAEAGAVDAAQVDALDGFDDLEVTPTVADVEPVAPQDRGWVASRPDVQRSQTVDPPPAMKPTVKAAPTSSPASRPSRRDLPWLLDSIGQPIPVITPGDATSAIDRLLAATAELDAWLVYPTPVQQAFTGLVSAIARHVQDEAEVDLPADHRDAMRSWFSTMTHWSKLYKPGFVPGLSRKNGPAHGSWIDDAEHWWRVLLDFAVPKAHGVEEAAVRPWTPPRRPAEPEPEILDPGSALRDIERATADPSADLAKAIQLALDAGVGQRDPTLVRALLPHAGRVAKLPGLKTLKSALKAAVRGPADTADEDVTVVDAPTIPDDWQFFPLTRGKNAVLVGGDRRPEAADRIRDAFGFAACTWEDTEPRRIAALASRIRAHSVDVVIVLKRYISHSEMDQIVDASKDSDTAYVVVDSGYGVAQVRLAVERYLRSRVEA